MQFINRRPALKLLPFLVLGILLGEYTPQLNTLILFFFIISFLGILTKYKTFAIPFCIIAIGFLNHNILQSNQPIPLSFLNKTQTFKCELISIKQKSQKVDYIFNPINYNFGKILVRSLDSLNVFPGDVMNLTGKFIMPRNSRNPGAFDYKNYLAKNGIHSIVLNAKIDSVILSKFSLNKFYFNIRLKIIQQINEFIDSPYNTLLIGLLLGEKGELNFELLERFRTLGVIHVLAVSGLHVGFIFIILNLISQILRLNPRNKLILITTCLLIYMGITGYPPSVIRAGTLGILYSYAQYRQKNADIWNILAWTAFFMLMINTNSIFKVGFQLSFGAVSGIIFFMSQTKYLKEKLNLNYQSKFLRIMIQLTEGMAVSIGALVGTFIPVAIHFHEISIIGIFFNIIIIPITFLIIIFGIITIIISFINPFLAEIYGNCVYSLGWVLDEISIRGNKLNISMISLGGISELTLILLFMGLLLIFYFRNSRYFQSLFIYILILSFSIIWQKNYKNEKVYITFLDVGQGDACIVHTNKFAILIDAGYVGFGKDYGRTVILPHLKYLGIEQLDLAIFSHPHADHIGGFDYLANKVFIKEIWDTKNNFHSKLYKKIIEKHKGMGTIVSFPNPGEIYKIDEVSMTILYPDSLNAQNAHNVNDASIVLRLDHGENSILFLGDAEHGAEEIVSKLNQSIRSDVIKIGHHGSKTSSKVEIVENVKANFGVISVGQNNKFKHPANEVVNRWVKNGVEIFRTDYHGAITIVSDGFMMNFYTEVRD